jgi:hypothetical protein
MRDDASTMMFVVWSVRKGKEAWKGFLRMPIFYDLILAFFACPPPSEAKAID